LDVIYSRSAKDKCVDNPVFTDSQGYRCSAWTTRLCFLARKQFGLDHEGMMDLYENCPRACGVCEDVHAYRRSKMAISLLQADNATAGFEVPVPSYLAIWTTEFWHMVYVGFRLEVTTLQAVLTLLCVFAVAVVLQIICAVAWSCRLRYSKGTAIKDDLSNLPEIMDYNREHLSWIPCEMRDCHNFHRNTTGPKRGFCCSAHAGHWHQSRRDDFRRATGSLMMSRIVGYCIGFCTLAGACCFILLVLPLFTVFGPRFGSVLLVLIVLALALTVWVYNHVEMYIRQREVETYPDEVEVVGIDADWAMSFRPSLLSHVMKELQQKQEATRQEYDHIWEGVPDKQVLLTPAVASRNHQKELRQCKGALDQLYEDALCVLPALVISSKAIAQVVGVDTKNVLWGIKKPMRIFKKTLEDDVEKQTTLFWDDDFRRTCDIARTSIECEDAHQVKAVLEKLMTLRSLRQVMVEAEKKGEALGDIPSEEDDVSFEFLRCKNRFQLPSDGYRDALVNMKIQCSSQGEEVIHIVEFQVHLKAMGDVKHGGGHRMYKWFRRLKLSDLNPTYEGQVDDQGRPHGHGHIMYPDGSTYTGPFRDGLRDTRPLHEPKASAPISDLKQEHTGTFQFANGDRYVGEFHLDHPSGHGSYLYADGSFEKGSFTQGQPNGEFWAVTRRQDVTRSWIAYSLGRSSLSVHSFFGSLFIEVSDAFVRAIEYFHFLQVGDGLGQSLQLTPPPTEGNWTDDASPATKKQADPSMKRRLKLLPR